MSDSESDDAGSRELVVAARKGDLPQVKRLLKDWPSPESLEESLQSALEGAVQGGQVPVASYPLGHGAEFSSDISHLAIQ